MLFTPKRMRKRIREMMQTWKKTLKTRRRRRSRNKIKTIIITPTVAGYKTLCMKIMVKYHEKLKFAFR